MGVGAATDGYYLIVYDRRIVMDLVHRYGRACGEQDHARAGVLYSEIVRAIQDDEESPRPADVAERGDLRLLAS